MENGESVTAAADREAKEISDGKGQAAISPAMEDGEREVNVTSASVPEDQQGTGESTPVPNKRFRDILATTVENRRKSGSSATPAFSSDDFISLASTAEPEPPKAPEPETPRAETASLDLENIDLRAPWARGRKYVSKSRDRTACLHEEILDFVDFISPTAAENRRRSALVQQFQGITKELWPEASLHVFGSYATGMHLPSSDIDMVVMGCEDTRGLFSLAKAIRADGGFDRIQARQGGQLGHLSQCSAL